VARLLVLAAGVALAAHRFAGPPAKGAKAVPSAPASKRARTDALGDPLPPGAVMRLGSVRLVHDGAASCAAYSPDGKLLASGGWWGSGISLWDPLTGKEVGELPGPHDGVNAIAFSPDGKLLAGAGIDRVAYVWDLQTRKIKHRLTGYTRPVEAVAFSPAGVIVAADAASVRFWDARRGTPLKTLTLEGGELSAMSLSPDGRVVTTAAADRVVRLWDAGNGQLLHRLAGHKDRVGHLTFSPDGAVLASTGRTQTLLWQVAGGKPRGALRPTGGGTHAVFSPDGKLLAVGGEDYTLRLVDWAAGKEVRALHQYADRVRCLAFAPGGKTLAAVSDGSALHLWEVPAGKPRLALPGHRERLNSVAVSADGRTIATAAWDGTVRLWDARTGQEERRLVVAEKARRHPALSPERLSRVAFSPDSRFVAAVRGDEVTVLWEARTGKEVDRFRAGSFAFAPTGKMLACGERGSGRAPNSGVIRLYDLATRKKVHELRGHLTTIASLVFSADGRTLLSTGHVLEGARFGDPGESETRFVRLWDVATGRERHWPAPKAHGVKALSPDGRTWVSTVMLGKTISLGEMATGGQRAELAGHTEMVFGVAFSPDGRLLASAGMDRTVRLWSLPGGKEVARLEGHRSWVLSVAFSPDGKSLVSGGLDTTALVWDVSRFLKPRAAGPPLSAAELERCWADLAGESAAGYRAVARLASSGAQTARLLQGRLRPAVAADAKRLQRLIADLNSDQFETREKASRELAKLDELAVPALEKALAGKPDLEVARRLQKLLDAQSRTALTRGKAREVRAVEALEYSASREARRLLEALAKGAPQARLTRQAKEALSRLRKRSP
jgi:WD40 repeat protein